MGLSAELGTPSQPLPLMLILGWEQRIASDSCYGIRPFGGEAYSALPN